MARFGEINAQYFDDAGDPLGSGKLYFYESGTTTPKVTYADINFTIPNTNPVILTAAGRQPNIFFNGNAKGILTDKNDVQILVRDPIGETGTNFGDAWVATKIYSANAVVIGSDGVYYRSLANGNQNNNPATTSGFWTLLYSVEWNASITYQEGSVVTYNGEQFQSLTNSNVNNNPSTSPANWVLLSFAWISTATYADNQNAVGSDGVLYTSQQGSNTGNDPTNAANRPAYWVGTSADAATSAAAAATSASNAATSASNAATSASNAATSETNAGNSATAAATSATNAAASATASAATAGAALWVSGQTYNAGDAAISLVNLQTYRAETTTSGTTDPSADSNWTQLGYSLPSQTGNSGKFLTTNGTADSWAEVNTNPTKATLSQTFSANDNATLTLSTAITSGAPIVSVTKEVAQTGVTNNNWDAAAGSYTLENTAYSTTLSFVGFDISGSSFVDSFSVSSQSAVPQEVKFNTDGTKMFILGSSNNFVYEYTLSTGFDVSTALYSQSFSIAGQETEALGLAFNPSGTKMFVCGNTGQDVNEYTLSTGYDVSTASFVDSFSVSGQDTSPSGIAFNSDGTKMFIAGNTGRDINEYTLSTGYDVSTSSFVDSFSVASQALYVTGVGFNSDGTQMFFTDATTIYKYTLTTGFDVSTATYSNVSFDFSAQETSGSGFAFNSDGTKLFISGYSGDAVYEYTVGTSLALGTGSFASTDIGKTINVNNGALVLTATDGSYHETTAPTTTDAAASGEWSMTAVIYDATADVLTLSNYVDVYNLADASYSSLSFSVLAQETRPNAISWNTDGTKFFTAGDTGNVIEEYTCSVGFDLSSTVAFSGNGFSIAGQESSVQGLAFNTDGTKFFIVGMTNDTVYEYTCSTGFDLGSTVAYSGNSFSVNSQETNPRGLAFNTDGTKFFVIGYATDSIYEYTCSVGFDLSSTVAYSGNSFSVTAQETTPQDIVFNPDGTKFFVMGDTGSPVDSIFEYTCSVGFDLSSTVAYSGVSFSVNSQETEPTGLAFSADGSKFFVVGETGYVYQYSSGAGVIAPAPTGYQPAISYNIDSTYWTDINSLTATNAIGSGNVFYAVSNDARDSWSILDNTDGTRDIVRDNSGTWQYNSNGTYTSETWVNATTNTEVAALREAMEGASVVSNQFDISTSVYSQSFDIAAQGDNPSGIAFNSDGTKMFIPEVDGQEVNEYDLSTGFDVSTALYSRTFSVSAQETFPSSIAFNTDGTKMFILGRTGDDVNEYTLSTGFNVSTASFVDSYSIAGQETFPTGLAFNTDGTKMFVVGFDGDDVNEYTLATGFDVSTASFVDSFSIAAQETLPEGIAFNTDGTKMFVVGRAVGQVHEYTLSTGFDVSTASFVDSFGVSAQDSTPFGLAFNTDGTKMLLVGALYDNVLEYSVGTTAYANQMDSTALNAITDANQITLGDDLDFAAILYYASGSTVPTYSGTAINYDANVLNNGAILGTDYNFDFPASNKVRITAVNAANYKVRVV